jgi:acetyl-CoA C-acetyltransferase
MSQPTAVLVGIAQLEQRIKDPLAGKEPLALMVDAVKAAAEDAGSNQLLTRAGSICVSRGIWPYKNPAKVIAEQIGSPGAQTVMSPFGGNYVQTAVSQAALDIQAGAVDVAILTGAECGYTQTRAAKAGVALDWQEAPGEPDRRIGKDQRMRNDAEKAIDLGRPIQVYPLFEIALRYARGETPEQHLKRVSELWAGFSAVAAANPHAWIRDAFSAETIRTPSPSNRPVSFPYPKLMNSNSNVDQASALILCSTDVATRLGIDPSKWIYPWVGTDAQDHLFVSNRDNLYSSPAIRFAGGRCLELAGVDAAGLDLVDIYSCFPSAVQVAARELGLSEDRPLTVTGGLTFHGGPMNNYVMHAIARMAELLRAGAGRNGLVTANGGLLTKHAFGFYSSQPSGEPFKHEDLQTQVDATPRRDVVQGYEGKATIESYTVMYGAEGPTVAHLACRTPEGNRAWANNAESSVLQAMTKEEFCGRAVTLDGRETAWISD